MRYLLELETNGLFEIWDRLIWINSLLPHHVIIDHAVVPLLEGS
jgi:hypothetical protein